MCLRNSYIGLSPGLDERDDNSVHVEQAVKSKADQKLKVAEIDGSLPSPWTVVIMKHSEVIDWSHGSLVRKCLEARAQEDMV